MIDSVNIPSYTMNENLQAYLVKYLAMMMCICSIFLRMKGDAASDAERKAIWQYLLIRNRKLYALVFEFTLITKYYYNFIFSNCSLFDGVYCFC